MIAVFLSFLARAGFVLGGVALATFALLWHAPGDAALSVAMARHGSLVSEDVRAEIAAQMGLEAGFWQVFWNWLRPLLQGDLGNSAVTGRAVGPDLWAAMSHTFPLALSGLFVGLMLALPLAMIATRNPGSLLDRAAVATAALGTAIPAFWLGLLLILLFAVQLGWLPAMGARTPLHMVLPASTLGLGVAASLMRITRSGILEARRQPFIPAFVRRGVAPIAIRRDHIAPHAAIPVVTVLGLELAFLMEGLVVVEVIFGRPGLGSLLIRAILTRDFAQVQAVVMLTALTFVIINLLVDIVCRRVDPRLVSNDA